MPKLEERGTPARPELGRMVDLWRIDPNWRPGTALQKVTSIMGPVRVPAKREIARVSKMPYEVLESTGRVGDQEGFHIRLDDGTVYWARFRQETSGQ